MTVKDLMGLLRMQDPSASVMLRLCYGGLAGELGVAYTIRQGDNIVALEAYESAHPKVTITNR